MVYSFLEFPVSYDTNEANSANGPFFEMTARWDLINDLDGGTFRMRRRGIKWLPRNIEESDIAYEKRLSQSVLTPLYVRSIDNIASKPFSTGFAYKNMPSLLVDNYFNDIDLEGNTLEQFAYNIFREGWNKGLSHILPAFPFVDPNIGPASRTIQYQIENNIRPFLKKIPSDNVFAWQFTEVFGKEVLTNVRYFSTRAISQDFRTKTVFIIVELRVTPDGVMYNEYTQTDLKTFEGNIVSEWILSTSMPLLKGNGEPLEFIPLVTFYTNKIDDLVAYPPLEDVAYLNHQHYVASSDQNTIVTWARLPLLIGTGLEPQPGMPMTVEEEKVWREQHKIRAAVNTIISAPEGAKLEFVEHSGAAINAGRTYIQDVENTARLTGLEVLVSDRRSGNVSATEQSIQAAQQTTTVMRSVSALEDALELALNYMMLFEANPVEIKKGSISINKDYAISVQQENIANELLTLKDAGIIDDETILFELKRRRLLSDEILDLPDAPEVTRAPVQTDR